MLRHIIPRIKACLASQSVMIPTAMCKPQVRFLYKQREMDPSTDGLQQSVSAFVVGCTGEVGKELVKALAASPAFSHLVLVGRRQVDLHLPPDQNQKVEQRVVDFERLSEYTDAFQGCDMGFCALGTTRAKAGTDGFVRVDHDYVVEVSKLAKEAGCQQFHLVSSQGANKNSWLLFPRTKGLAEEHVGEVGFSRLSVYRPALLLCEREEPRRLEGWAQNLARKFDGGGRFSVTTAAVARAMVRNALRPGDRAVEVLENGDIINLGFAEGN